MNKFWVSQSIKIAPVFCPIASNAFRLLRCFTWQLLLGRFCIAYLNLSILYQLEMKMSQWTILRFIFDSNKSFSL